MSKRTKYSAEQKYNILMEYENGCTFLAEIYRVYEISDYSFYKWRKLYKKHGLKGLEELRIWKKYSKKLKEELQH